MTPAPPSPPQAILVLVGFDDDAMRRVRAIAPASTRVEKLSRKDPRFAELLPEAEVVVGTLSGDEARRAQNLRWLQLASAGAARHIERLPTPSCSPTPAASMACQSPSTCWP